MKRDLLAEAAAARRRAGVSSTTPSVVDDHREMGLMSSSPARALDSNLPGQQGPAPAWLGFQTAQKGADPVVSAPTHDMNMWVLTSEGFATLNEERKRSPVEMEDEDDVFFVKTKAAKKE